MNIFPLNNSNMVFIPFKGTAQKGYIQGKPG